MAFAFLANGAQLFFEEKGKPQRGRKAAAPLHTPRAFFKEFLVVDEGGVDLCLYAWILDVGRCADLVPVFFDIYGDTLCRSRFCILRYL